MRCVICGHAAKRRKITDNHGHESVKDLCDDCARAAINNPRLKVTNIDDGTEGDVFLPDEGSQI